VGISVKEDKAKEEVLRPQVCPARAAVLLNHALRLEYAAVVHLEQLAVTVQDAHSRHCLFILSTESIDHAVKTAAIIRELGGTPDWRMWTPPDCGTLARLFRVQLGREILCRGIYIKAAALAAGGAHGASCAALAEDEGRHIKLVEDALLALSKKEQDPQLEPAAGIAVSSAAGAP